jgi:hypothetical protein
MKKWSRGVVGMAVGVVLGLIAVSAYSQDDITTVNDSAFSAHMRPPVSFPHDTHNETAEIEECGACHHLYEDEKLVEDDTSEGMECSECHGPDGDGYPMDLVARYHNRCKGCHMEKKAGPVMCAECHTRR